MSIKHITRSIVISATLALTPWQTAFAQSSAQSIIENWVKQADGVEFLIVDHNGIATDSANITTVTDLSIRLRVDGVKTEMRLDNQKAVASGKLDYRITFPSIRFDNLALENGYYSARSITAETAKLAFEIKGNRASSSRATGEYRDIGFNNIKWARLPEVPDDASRPISRYYPLFEALTDISFDNGRVGATAVSQTTGNPAINMRVSYGASTMGRADRGNFSNMLISGMQMVMQTPDNKLDASFSIGEMSISNYDYRSMVQVFKPGNIAATDNDPFKPVLGSMIMKDFKLSSSGGTFSMDSIGFDDIGVRSPGLSVLEKADQMFLASKSGQKEPDPKEIVRLIANVYGALRLGEFSMAGLKFSAPGSGQGKLDLYKIADLSANGLGEFSFKGLSFSDLKGGYGNLDLLSFGNITFPPLEALLGLEEAGKKNDILAIMKALPTLGYYVMRGLDVKIPGQGEVALGEARMDMAGFIGPIPTDVDINVRDANIPVKFLDRKQRQVMKAMGFENINISYGLRALWDEASNVLSMNTNANLKDGGVIDVDVKVGGIPRSAFENPLTAQKLIALVTVNSANVNFEDRSIVDKGLAVIAAQQGTDPETLKAQAVGLLPIMLQVLNKPAFVNELSAAVKTFLETKGSISASATPAAPVSVIQLIGVGGSAPGAIIDLLNVKVKAN